MLAIVLTILAAIVVIVAILLHNSSQKQRVAERKSAAAILCKNLLLQDSLGQGKMNMSYRGKNYLSLEWKDEDKEEYVFDPDRGIHIGRDMAKSDLCIQDEGISRNHCLIFTSGGRIWLEDQNSENGLWLYGIFSKKRISRIELREGMKIGIGPLQMKVHIVYLDQNGN